MRRFIQSAGKQANLVNDARKEPNADKDQPKNKISKIACMDNGTMVEAFKYLNYCQLAKNSLASNRFRNLIQTHRHKLALLYVDRISMYCSIATAAVKIYDKELSHEAYNEWVISNSYSKQVPVEDQIATTQSTQNISNVYELYAFAHYKACTGVCGSAFILALARMRVTIGTSGLDGFDGIEHRRRIN